MDTNFKTCSTEDLQLLIKRAKAGEVDLNEHWSVGDVRTIKVPEELINGNICIDCTIESIEDPGINQQAIIQAHVDKLPADLKTDVRPIIAELVKNEFGRAELQDTNSTTKDVNWHTGQKRTVPDVVKKFGTA